MKNNFLCLLLSFVFVFLSLITLNISIFAQNLDNVTVSGKIVDSNSAPISGATVTATLTTTGVERTVLANEEGRYRIIELAPGIYSVKAVMKGFALQEKTNLATVAGQNVQLDFNLAPSSVNAEQIIMLEGDDSPLVDTTRTVVGGTITEREIEEIPNNTRNALDLVLTLGGTSEESLSTSGLAEDRNASPSSAPLEQGNFSLSGGTAYSNNLTIDGLDNNDDRSSRDRFQPSLESIAEVQVITNQFSAEYGRASGGRINLRTKAGGNKFRGRFFMFFRDDNLNSNTFYNNTRKYTPIAPLVPPDTNPLYNRLPLTEYNPGFTLIGPVILPYYNGRNKTFFSVAYEFDKFEDTTLIDAYVPDGSNPRFALPPTTGGTQTCDNSSAAACIGPSPTAAYVSPYTKSFATPSINHVVTARVDHKLFKNNNLTIGWQFGRKNNKRTNGAATTRIEDAFQARNNDTDAYNITDNQVFGANAVNQFRAQYSVYKPSYQTAAPLDPVVLISYRDPVSNSVKTLIAGNSTTGTSQNFADSRQETRWQFQDSLTYIWRSHTFKGGFDAQRVNSQTLGLGDATGTFNFGSVLNYQNNVMSRYRQNFGTAQDVKNTYWSVFLNDELKGESNLTLNYGLRYERETAVSDNNNFGPRLGIAWDPFKKGKGVIRFGAGIFYNRVLLRTVGDSIQNRNSNLVSFDSNTILTTASGDRRAPILAAIATRFPNSYASVADLKALIAATCATIVTPYPCDANTGFVTNVTSAGNPLRSVDANLKIPESYQFNIGFEREIAKGFVFEANYTWNKTVHLWRDSNPNAPRLPAGYGDWTAYLLANPFVFTNDNGTTRTYNFALGLTTDGSGVGTGCSFTLTGSCIINLNTTSTTSTPPSTAVTGSSANANGSPIGIALAAIARFRPDQTVEETSRIGSRGSAFYQGLILEVRSRYRKLGNGFGASMRFNYTLSGTRDDGLNNTANAEIDGDFSREWTRNLQDRRHRLSLSGTFEMPWWLGKLKFSPLVRFGSSAPFNLSGGSDRNLDDVSTDRLNFSGNLQDLKYREPSSPFNDAFAAQFSLPPIGAKSGNLPRNAGIGPSFYTFDLSVTREWKIGERMKLRPVIQFDNILNATVFSYGAEFINFTGLSSTATAAQTKTFKESFLVPNRTYRQRQIRVGLRFDF
ncbi:MAG: carboxypeptidase regulatory-like domain-containing protein [Actinomycetota bacterium]